MAITTLPPAPQPTDSTAQFNVKAFAFVASLDGFVTETNATATAVNTSESNAATSAGLAATSATNAATQVTLAANQVTLAAAQVALAADQADAAATSAETAAAATNAVLWVSGTTYAIGFLVYSPLDNRVYRRLTAGAGTTDPSADATNWVQLTRVVEQSDIGTAPNEIPLNQYLGSMAYQDLNNVVIEGGILAGLDIQSLADQVSTDAVNTGIVNAEQFLAGSSAVLRGGATNLLSYSEDFSNASWSKVNSTVTTNTNIAPDGTLTADTVNFSAIDGQIRKDNVGTAGVAYTLSVWLAGSGTIYLSAYDNISSSQSTLVTLTPNLTRYTFTFTFGAGATDRRVYPANRLNNAATTTSVVVWGAQLNVGSTPQPYLKTVATAVTTAYAAPLESPNGLALPLLATMTPARNSDMTFELASNTSLVVKVKGSDGTVRSATLTLA